MHVQMKSRQSVHMLNFEYEDDIKMKIKNLASISRTLYLTTETISRPPNLHETIPLKWFSSLHFSPVIVQVY
jgi:hypothetical protein